MLDSISSALLLGHSATASFEKHARELIREAETNIARLDSQIRDLECLRDKERGVIASLRMVLVPIRKLPVELLREIFMLSVEHRPSWMIVQSIKEILGLSQVCAHWRRVAHNTPRLWTSCLRFRPSKPLSDTHVAGTKLWLERSTPLPLEIDIYSSLETRVIAPLMDTVLSVAHRWKSLELVVQTMDVLEQITPGTLKELDTLSVRCTAADPYTIITPFLSAPRLRHVELGVPYVRCILLPWAQLIHVTLTFALAPHMAVDILSQCTSIDLELKLSTEDGDSLVPIFQRFRLPALKNLTVDFEQVAEDYGDWPAAAVKEFQLRCPDIEDITITFCTLTSEELKTLLVHAAQLVRLYLEYCRECIDDEFFSALRYSESDPVHLAPKLEDLYLEVVGSHFEEESLKTMIKSRWWTDAELLAMPSPPAVARWESVNYRGGGYEELDAEFVANFSSEGLKLSLYY
ncbi:hypothetical protein C8J57DRAFT_1490247 [Mycena rebaudengoi]|nr:hypothetical protein C8J57DRAFT_1490247 [Mycena rebaudengoi]